MDYTSPDPHMQHFPDAYALAEAIAQRCEDAHPYQDGWRARCPNHQGKSDTSFSITSADDRVLIKCFGECASSDVVKALGLTMADLFVKSPARRNGQKHIVKEYGYYDATGTLVHQTVRYEPKDFHQRRPDPAHPGEWLWSLKGIEPVLYHLPQVLAAVQRGETIYLVEGEKDAENLQALGVTATCNAMGAGKWRKSYSEVLRGTHVVILPHHDDPGLNHALKVAKALDGIAATIKIVPGIDTGAPGSDVSDWLQAGGTRPELEALVDQFSWYTVPPEQVKEDAQQRQNGSAAGLDRGHADKPRGPLPYSDTYNARALVLHHGENLHYCWPWGKWLVWTGSYWQYDDTGAVRQKAKQTIKRLARLAEDLDDMAAKALMAHVKKSLSTAAIKAMIEGAQDEPGIPVLPEALDADGWLLNCTNGTLDLQTGTLRPHERTDLLTRCIPVVYDPQAQCSAWKAFLWRIMAQNQALIDFLQRAVGYALTGEIREHVLLILWGKGRNGKSTLLNTLRALLGPYALKAPSELLMVSHNDRHPTERADLFGKRFVAAIETEQGRRLAEVFVKEATGGDPIRARRMREDFWEFWPTHKLFLATNHKPVIKGTDSAIWERIRLIPFTVTIPKDERDTTLPDKLQAELPGILAWAVRGCLAWQQEGLGEPDAVLTATEGYRAEMDLLATFLQECCKVGDSDYVKVKAPWLYLRYQAWCKAINEEPLSGREFIARLEERGFTRKQGTGNQYYWQGLDLLNIQEEERVGS